MKEKRNIQCNLKMKSNEMSSQCNGNGSNVRENDGWRNISLNEEKLK
jgi:hypothetical protein